MRLITCVGLLLVLPAIALISKREDLPINEIQVIGSHNSYKQAIDPALFKLISASDSATAKSLDYEHLGMAEQLNMGLRNLEIDVYADEKGGKYAHPKGLELVKGQPEFDGKGEMDKPGFKVLHVPDFDFRSSALSLKSALQQLKKWSENNPQHTPVFITLEAKDDSIKRKGFTQPEVFTANTFDELDATVLENLGKEHIITPDEVRGKYKTLEEAVLTGNWPKLSKAKGKFIFVLDAIGKKRSLYINGHASLAQRVLFANADAGTPEAAFMIRNNPTDVQIPVLVKKGYLVRTRADSDTKQARKNDFSDFEAACKSGAQIITTDYYKKSTHFKSDYVVSFADGKYFRENPLFKK
ncbi:phosphatidylinositol-specific phospholipase C1-like protein [Pedobacter fastidiosus]|uniref:Phosphatidylinositol-specific phospholipase C1-like protein n=1 Tax=Pedobacter fastidiosus TaxID=2765361 RepID=A0ABR7KS36_9SPHI|nr:phosphatidylinositol-specific phospholipase C1-like protein [Pedobacter fastidiosus]MBC6110886.1 phosphatidylinositol-specific phospholipase C1-like protein [Pedobacter fastidiosus]